MGELNPGAAGRLLRNRMMHSEKAYNSVKRTLNAIFAVSRRKEASRNVVLLLVRMLAGALLIFTGLSTGFGGLVPYPDTMQLSEFQVSLAAVTELAAGSVLCLGLCTRVLLSSASVIFGFSFIQGIMVNEFIQTDAFLCMLTMVFALTGAGRISVDAILRRGIFHLYRRRRQRIVAKRLTYEAFQYQIH